MFNQILWTLLSLPGLMSQVSEAVISLTRLRTFLDRPEIIGPEARSAGSLKCGLKIMNSTFQHFQNDKDIDEGNKKKVEEKPVTLSESEDNDISLNKSMMLSKFYGSEGAGNSALENKEFSLKNINLTIGEGDLAAIVGRNGAGKVVGFFTVFISVVCSDRSYFRRIRSH